MFQTSDIDFKDFLKIGYEYLTGKKALPSNQKHRVEHTKFNSSLLRTKAVKDQVNKHIEKKNNKQKQKKKPGKHQTQKNLNLLKEFFHSKTKDNEIKTEIDKI